jgi:acetyl esterase/lipase
VYLPSPAPAGGTGPAILILHEGGFMMGNFFSSHVTVPAQDLAAAGYYTVIADYRLAPCGLVTGQPCHDDPDSGRPPQQTDDVKAFVRALRADEHCNGLVGIVGGSAGGSHAAFVALDRRTSTGWPNWTAADRPDATVCLSGAYDLADRTPETYGPNPLPDFIFRVENYTNSCIPTEQHDVSPVARIDSGTASTFKPMFFINSEQDSMPVHQMFDIECALQRAGVASSQYELLTIPHSDAHAFQFWSEWDGKPVIGDAPTVLIKGDVIQFLDAHLK